MQAQVSFELLVEAGDEVRCRLNADGMSLACKLKGYSRVCGERETPWRFWSVVGEPRANLYVQLVDVALEYHV